MTRLILSLALWLVMNDRDFIPVASSQFATLRQSSDSNYLNDVYRQTLTRFLTIDSFSREKIPAILHQLQHDNGKIYVQIESGADLDSLPKIVGSFSLVYFHSSESLNYAKVLKSSKYFVSLGLRSLTEESLSITYKFMVVEKKSGGLVTYPYDEWTMLFNYSYPEHRWMPRNN